jgi:phosphatidylserine decarboxylase
VSFAREGLIFIAIAALVAAGSYALALNRRSWPLWLLAFLLTVITLWVAYLQYTPGKFLNASGERASLENEQMSVGIETPNGRVLVRQIAGLIARRIVTYSKEGEHVDQGQRMGLIRFGSRVDVFLPVNAVVQVKIGDLTVAGTSVIAEMPTP